MPLADNATRPRATPGDSRRGFARTLPVGAEIAPGNAVHFRVWAPASTHAAIELRAAHGALLRVAPLTAEGNGYHSALVEGVGPGARYKIKLERGTFPDPASRFQPDGPHGPSEVVNLHFAWTDEAWRGRALEELALYELHVGTFTPAGTWRAALERLPALAELGVTALEVMPVAEFPGRFGWGYDGVDLFAPTRLYGRPDDFRAFVDRAHALGLAVILDVVYNHLGPDGNYLREFSPHYFSSRYANEWGEPFNFDGDESAPVREFFAANARYWIGEFHLDGLRLDATQQMFDASPRHVVADIAEAARAAAPERRLAIIAENETQDARLARPADLGGCGLDAIWNDDFHHAALVAATGRAEAYYSGYRGAPQEFVSCAKYGFLYQGQWYRWQQKRRGTPSLEFAPRRFVNFLENHDQVANSIAGKRLHQMTSPGRFRALTALALLSPQIPMLFQGQEFAASAPFLYFADHHPELAQLVARGRGEFLAQFPGVAALRASHALADPAAETTFRRCQLDWSERERHAAALELHRDLLRLRRDDPTLRHAVRVDGAVLGATAFVLRFFSAHGDDRLLLVNLGAATCEPAAAEPLLAPPPGRGWRVAWSSEAPAYGGAGLPPLETTAHWHYPGEAAVLFVPDENVEPARAKLSEKD